jgi:hypothetical protein
MQFRKRGNLQGANYNQTADATSLIGSTCIVGCEVPENEQDTNCKLVCAVLISPTGINMEVHG